jgi:hypothetical protein
MWARPRLSAAAWVMAVLSAAWVVFSALLVMTVFIEPSTTSAGFSSRDLPTISDRGDVDCGGSSLTVIRRGPRVAGPDSDLRRQAEAACRSDARFSLGLAAFGVCSLVVTATAWLLWARRRGELGDRWPSREA